MRLIDADAAYKAACEGADNWDGGCSPYRDDCIREEMDKVPTASPWHRVEEELPKEHMWCFVYTDEPDMIMPIRIAFYTASCMGKGSWYHYESGSDITDEVDYWAEMLLEGPKLNHDLPWPIEPPREDA